MASSYPFVTAVAEDLVNRFLRWDPETRRRLGALDGKIVCVCYSGSKDEDLRWYLLPFEGGFRIRESIEGNADVEISGNLPLFLKLMLGSSAAGIGVSTDMQIRGDIELGQRFKSILDGIDVDWEEGLSRSVGDVIAHKLARAVRGYGSWKRQAARDLARDFVEYTREEAAILPYKEQVDAFLDDVDQLRASVDRLQARIRQLEGGMT